MLRSYRSKTKNMQQVWRWTELKYVNLKFQSAIHISENLHYVLWIAWFCQRSNLNYTEQFKKFDIAVKIGFRL